MWDKEDHFGRWVQFFCGLILTPGGAAAAYYGGTLFTLAVGLVFIYIGLRCLWYAITGSRNINLDDLNNDL